MLYNTPPYPANSVVTHNYESLGFQDYEIYTSCGVDLYDPEMKSFASLKPLAMEKILWVKRPIAKEKEYKYLTISPWSV